MIWGFASEEDIPCGDEKIIISMTCLCQSISIIIKVIIFSSSLDTCIDPHVAHHQYIIYEGDKIRCLDLEGVRKFGDMHL